MSGFLQLHLSTKCVYVSEAKNNSRSQDKSKHVSDYKGSIVYQNVLSIILHVYFSVEYNTDYFAVSTLNS